MGILGDRLFENSIPIADASSVFLGNYGKVFISVATLISIFGINIGSSIVTPKCGSSLAEEGSLPAFIGKTNKYDAPYVAIIISLICCIPLVLTGSFEQLAVMSVIARFAQYIPTCLSVIVLRKRTDVKASFKIPFGPVIPIVAILGSLWLLQQAWAEDISKPITQNRVLIGLGAMLLIAPLYIFMKKIRKSSIKINQKILNYIFREKNSIIFYKLFKNYFSNTIEIIRNGDVAYLKVVDNTNIGTFIDMGLTKDILVPFKAKTYPLFRDEKYLFYIYLDKSGRIAATTDIDSYLETDHTYNVGDVVNGVVYGFQTNNSAMICVDNKYAGVILHNEYFTELKAGDVLENLHVIKIYDDGKLGLSPRGNRKDELDTLENKILSYLEGSDGYMRFNDKSDPKDISILFNSSKKNFKRALGVLMKKDLIYQDEDGTYLK